MVIELANGTHKIVEGSYNQPPSVRLSESASIEKYVSCIISTEKYFNFQH